MKIKNLPINKCVMCERLADFQLISEVQTKLSIPLDLCSVHLNEIIEVKK